jgi:hypothetical protein
VLTAGGQGAKRRARLGGRSQPLASRYATLPGALDPSRDARIDGPGRGGGILNISLFGVISPGMRPNGVFFRLFCASVDPPPETGVLATFDKSQKFF